MVFVSLVLIQLLKAYTFRSLTRSILKQPFTNRWLNLAVGWELGLLALLVYVPFLEGVFGTRPMPMGDWAAIGLAAALVVLVLEALKLLMRRRLRDGPRLGMGASTPSGTG